MLKLIIKMRNMMNFINMKLPSILRMMITTEVVVTIKVTITLIVLYL